MVRRTSPIRSSPRSPELKERVDAYAAGVNEYIAQVKAGRLPPPSEINLAGGFLTSDDPLALMKPFDRRDVAGMMSVVFYQSSFETGDVGRAAEVAQLPTIFSGVAFENLRKAGASNDLYAHIEPVKKVSSAAGFFLETAETNATGNAPMSAVTLRTGEARSSRDAEQARDEACARPDHEATRSQPGLRLETRGQCRAKARSTVAGCSRETAIFRLRCRRSSTSKGSTPRRSAAEICIKLAS